MTQHDPPSHIQTCGLAMPTSIIVLYDCSIEKKNGDVPPPFPDGALWFFFTPAFAVVLEEPNL